MNLVASGAGESEIFIWDLNSPDKPMTPGTKAQVLALLGFFNILQ
jgi:protein transport protein SEC31